MFHDQGTGMSDEVIQNARNPFYTTKPANSGTGLGLSISHSIISEYGGTLAFESREKEYTKIIINLPAGDNGK
jgi:signal transduction histidine kinase